MHRFETHVSECPSVSEVVSPHGLVLTPYPGLQRGQLTLATILPVLLMGVLTLIPLLNKDHQKSSKQLPAPF